MATDGVGGVARPPLPFWRPDAVRPLVRPSRKAAAKASDFAIAEAAEEEHEEDEMDEEEEVPWQKPTFLLTPSTNTFFLIYCKKNFFLTLKTSV